MPRTYKSPRYWLMKSEPDVYSIQRLAQEGLAGWDGVRNYQARNYMRDQMQPGDYILFYHSTTTPPGVAGIAKVAETGVVDPTQFDPQRDYYDPKSTPENPRWIMVKVAFVEAFSDVLPLEQLRQNADLAGMVLLQKGSRLSVQPVSPEHFKAVLAQAKRAKLR